MTCELVTGHSGSPHVTAAQAAALNAGIIGRDTVILDTGKKMAVTMQTANSAVVDTGDCLIQGRHVSCDMPTTLQIASGSQGVKRIDYIAVRYTMDAETGIENAELVVLKGTPAASPQPPEVVTADIDAGATLAEFPLYEIRLNGLVPDAPSRIVHIAGFGGLGRWEKNESEIKIPISSYGTFYGSEKIITASNQVANASFIGFSIGLEWTTGSELPAGMILANAGSIPASARPSKQQKIYGSITRQQPAYQYDAVLTRTCQMLINPDGSIALGESFGSPGIGGPVWCAFEVESSFYTLEDKHE